jgi:hypothetical protein
MRILFVFLCVTLLACKSGNRRPAGIIPPEKMGVVMKQVFVADEWMAWQAEKDPTIPVFRESVALYRGIFKKEGVTEEQFRKSLRYYQDHPLELRTIMDTLMKHPGLEASATDTAKGHSPVPVILPRRRKKPQ